MKKLIALIDNGWNIKLYSHIKRTEVKGVRDFYWRFCWEAKRGKRVKESKWEGFSTPTKAVVDLLKKVPILKTK
jgi:hypothetical protein